jgi:hypothetical protein
VRSPQHMTGRALERSLQKVTTTEEEANNKPSSYPKSTLPNSTPVA